MTDKFNKDLLDSKGLIYPQKRAQKELNSINSLETEVV